MLRPKIPTGGNLPSPRPGSPRISAGRVELSRPTGGVSVAGMTDSVVQRQLAEVRVLLRRARGLFGPQPVAPPAAIGPDPAAAGRWVR